MEPRECPDGSCGPSADVPVWWAMSAVYNRSLPAAAFLKAAGTDHFVPMRYVVRHVGERKCRMCVPAVNNLIFVRTTPGGIRRLKTQLPYLQYLVCREGHRGRPIVVPDNLMNDFIRVATTLDEHNLYFTPGELDLQRGSRVRIHGGPFDGLVGTFLKVKGARDRRVVVSIDGVMSVAAATIRPDLIEVLPD